MVKLWLAFWLLLTPIPPSDSPFQACVGQPDWQVITEQNIRFPRHVFDLALHPSGEWLAAAGMTDGTWIYDADSLTLRCVFKQADNWRDVYVEWLGNSHQVMILHHPGTLLVYDTDTGALVHQWTADDQQSIDDMEVSTDGRWVAVLMASKYLSVLETQTWSEVFHTDEAFANHGGPTESLSWSPDSRWLSYSSYGDGAILGQMIIRQAVTWLTVQTVGTRLGSTSVVAWSPNGSYIAVGSVFDTWVFEVETGAVVGRLPTPGWYVEALAWSPDNHQLLIGGDNHLWVIDATSGDLTIVLIDESNLNLPRRIYAAWWYPDGQRIIVSTKAASPSALGELWVYDTEAWTIIGRYGCGIEPKTGAMQPCIDVFADVQ